LPEVFDDADEFERWFDFSALNEKEGQAKIITAEQKSKLVTNLHLILKPFLLRRLKVDVEHSLPKKREYILYAPLTFEQNELYQSILDKDVWNFLENKHLSRASTFGSVTPRKRTSESIGDEAEEDGVLSEEETTPQAGSGSLTPMSLSGRSTRKKARLSYREITDAEWYLAMEKAEKDQFKDDYTPSPEVLRLASSRTPSSPYPTSVWLTGIDMERDR
jgi:ATP-dependent DNA helicase